MGLSVRAWSAQAVRLFLLACALGAGPAGAQTEPPRFDVFEYAVEGNTVLEVQAIERAVYPFLGPERTIDDVQAARAALEKAYRDRGWGTVSVDIPEQRVGDGPVRLQVLEGRVSRTRVTGAKWFSQGWILEKVPAAAEGEVPHFPTLQAQLGTVNRTADRRVTPLLRPGRNPGTTEVDLQVEDALPLHGSVELNNKASANTTQARLAAALRYDNLFQRDHSIALQAQVSPQDRREVQVLSATYSMPAGEVGQDTLLLSVTRSDSEVPAGVGSTVVFGKGTIWGLRRNLTLGLAPGAYHLLSFGAEYKDFSETLDIGDGTGFATPVRYLPLSLSYTGIVDGDGGRRWQFGAGLTAGFSGLVNRDSEFADKRFGARGSFSLLKFDLGLDAPLPWAGWGLRAALNGQLSGDPLISNEQFVVGGADSVRGYLESAAAGDFGLRAALELRSPNWAGKDSAWLRALSGHAFVEGAAVELREPLPEQQKRFSIAGAGFGLRMATRPLGSLSLDLGWALRPVGRTERGDLRVHAAGSVEF